MGDAMMTSIDSLPAGTQSLCRMSASQKMEIPRLPEPLPLDDIVALVQEKVNDAVLNKLREWAAWGRRFASESRAGAEMIARWPDQVGSAPTSDAISQRHLLASAIMEVERDFERKFFPILWALEDQRKTIETYSPQIRAAWVGFIDPTVKAIEETLEIIRAARFQLQQPTTTGGRSTFTLTRGNGKAGYRAALAYKKIADEIFDTDSVITIEDFRGERYFLVNVPVADPDGLYRDQEEKIHYVIEQLAPECVGQAVLQYVPRSGAHSA